MAIDAVDYIFLMALENLLLILIIFWVSKLPLNVSIFKVVMLFICFLFLIITFSYYSIIFFPILFSFVLKSKFDKQLIFYSAYCVLIYLISMEIQNILIVDTPILEKVYDSGRENFFIVKFIIHVIINAGLVKITQKGIKKIDVSNEKTINVMIINLFTMILFINFIDYVAVTLGVKSIFSIGMIVVLLIMVLSNSVHIYIFNKQMKSSYEDKLRLQSIKDMEDYITKVESMNLQLRKFRHDYQNLISSLAFSLIDEENTTKSILMDYSNKYLSHNFDDIAYIYNVKDKYLKSLLTNKILRMVEMNIPYRFECVQEIECYAMETFDLIRILGNLIDNAIEEVVEIEGNIEPIKIIIFNDGHYATFEVLNPIKNTNISAEIHKPGITTKEGHNGLGLSSSYEIVSYYSDDIVLETYPMEGQFIATLEMPVNTQERPYRLSD